MKTKTDLRTSALQLSGPMLLKAQEAFAAYRYEQPEELRDGKGFCYVNTALGYFEIDIFSLLSTTAIFTKRGARVTSGENLEITEEVINAALYVLRRLPSYVMTDLIGIAFEHDSNRNLSKGDHPVTWAELSKLIYNREDHKGDLGLLQAVLKKLGPGSLEMDDLRDGLTLLFSRKGLFGPKAWQKLIKDSLHPRKRRGRPRKTEYDQIFAKQISNSKKETYGKLIRELPNADSETHETLRNRLKVAMAYRKKNLGRS
jgi:hypothetical protein